MMKKIKLSLEISIVLLYYLSPAAHAFQLEEVIVTAQKKEENLQDIPIAVSALSSDTATQLGIQNSSDIAIVTPGLTVSELFGSVQPYIRGVGNDLTQGVETSVATYVDGIYLKNLLSQQQNLMGIQRTEVLRGPQGTLYGRNATGGAINIITTNPGAEPEANIELGYGNYDDKSVSTYVSGPLSDSVFGNLTLNYNEREAYVENLSVLGDDIDDTKDLNGRAKILYSPSDSFEAILSVAYTDRDQDEIQVRPQAQVPSSGQILGAVIGGGNQTSRPHKVYTEHDNRLEIEQTVVGLHLDWEFDNFLLKSITSYQDIETLQYTDFDGTDTDFFAVDVDGGFETYTQEFQILSSPDSELEWIAGLYYLYDEGGFDRVLFDFGAAGNRILNEENTTEAAAVFGQLTYPFLDNWRVTAGLRYSYEEKELSEQKQVDNLGTGVEGELPFPVSEDWDAVTPKLAVDYTFENGLLLWASYTEGFKSGGFNTSQFTPGVIPEPLDPEDLESIEAGVKGDFLDGSLRLSASVFSYDYKDQHVQVISADASALVQNAASSSIEGFELEGQVIFAPWFSLDFGFSVLDAEYDEFPNAQAFIIGTSPGDLDPTGFINQTTSVDASGNQTVRSPDFTYFIAPRFDIPVSSGSLVLSGIYSYSDEFTYDAAGQGVQDDYGVLNASLTYTSENEGWYARLWGKNLTDEEYFVYVAVDNVGVKNSWAAPITYGLSVGVNF